MKKDDLKRAKEIEKAIEIIDGRVEKEKKILDSSNDTVYFAEGWDLRIDQSCEVFSDEEKIIFRMTVKLFKEILLGQYKKAKERLEDELNSL